MWMFPRNIRRINTWKLVQTAKIVEAATGDLGSQKVQDALYEALNTASVKRRANDYGVANSGGFRTYMAQLSCLGFFWKDRKAKAYDTTRAGEALIEAKAPGSVLRCQLLRMQYPSVYGLGNNVRIHPDMKVKPFVFLIRLLQDARLEHYLTAEDLAIPVIYGRRNADFEKCVQKILGLRAGRSLRSQIDSVDDLRTSKRCRPNDEEADWRTGLQDALEIGNTARNYLIAAQLAESSTRIKGAIELSEQTVALPEVAGWLAEGDRIEPLDPDHQEAWQQRYGRYDKTRASRTLSAARAVNGLAACVQAAFIQGHAANPFGFDVAGFISSEAKRWGCPEAEISGVIDPLLPSVPSIEDDIVRQASVSGGKEWLLLEKAMTSVMIRLGFDESEHIGQKKAPRDGGYPDIRVKASTMQTCGFADTKATSRYGMDTNDTNKLSLYYKNCWAEFPDQAPSSFFMYIAGGFDGKDASSVLNTLERCTQKYGRPVCAITVNAMLRLVRMNSRPGPEALVRAFSQRAYYCSAESIIRASA